jgi:hypothetical protein
MAQSRSYYKILLLFCALVWGQIVKAEYYSTAQNTLTHHLGFSIGGAECNNLDDTNAPVVHQFGGATALAVRYEMQYRTWFWGMGLEAAYQKLNNITSFADSTQRVDIDGDSLSYQYIYTSFKETDLLANISVPIYVGKYFDRVYALLGLSVEIPIWAQYTTKADMYTQGVYPWSISPLVSEGVNDFSALGFYPAQRYTYTAQYKERLRLVPFVELGYDFLNTEKINLRLGAYASCAIPVVAPKMVAISDYSAVDCNPKTQNQQNLEQNIRWNPIGRSDKYLATEYKLEVGAKITMLFYVPGKKICLCER